MKHKTTAKAIRANYPQKVIETLKPEGMTWDKFEQQRKNKVNKLLRQFIKEVYTK